MGSLPGTRLLKQLSLHSQDLRQDLAVWGCSQVCPGAGKLLPLLLQGALMRACAPTPGGHLSHLPQLPRMPKLGPALTDTPPADPTARH